MANKEYQKSTFRQYNNIKEEKIELEGQDYGHSRKTKESASKGASIKNRVLKFFELVESTIFKERDEKSISMSQFGGTKAFDVWAKYLGKTVNTQMNLDLMDNRKVSVLVHRRPEYKEPTYSMKESDFWVLIDAMALLALEVHVREGTDSGLTKESLYQGLVIDSIRTILLERNQLADSSFADGFLSVRKLEARDKTEYPPFTRKRALSPYALVEGRQYREHKVKGEYRDSLDNLISSRLPWLWDVEKQSVVYRFEGSSVSMTRRRRMGKDPQFKHRFEPVLSKTSLDRYGLKSSTDEDYDSSKT